MIESLKAKCREKGETLRNQVLQWESGTRQNCMGAWWKLKGSYLFNQVLSA